MKGDYRRKVFRGAWDRTWRLLGWSKEKAIGTAVLVVGTVLVGGVASLFNLVSNSITVLAGVAVVAVGVFLWGVFETQAEMYHAVSDEKERTTTRAEGGMGAMVENG
jgi:protein-S-isoprenylcysteine O-methyltransferase Ste14